MTTFVPSLLVSNEAQHSVVVLGVVAIVSKVSIPVLDDLHRIVVAVMIFIG